MNPAARILFAIAAMAAALFAVLAVISLGWLSPKGQSNFDARVLGYDQTAARAYLAVLPDSGKALYLGLFRWLDTIFPVLAAVAIGGAMWLNMAGRTVFVQVACLGMVAAYLVMDLAENAAVAQILLGGDLADQALVERSSNMTQLKWVFLVLSITLLFAMWRRNKGDTQ